MCYLNRIANGKVLLIIVTATVTFAMAVSLLADTGSPDPLAPPPRLSDTGLFADGSVSEVRDGILPFSPQYTLWSDGATKRRWLYLPPDTYIDGSDPDNWAFPPGTRLWKEFSLAGRRIETRLIERRTDGIWQFATYAWEADNGDAILARKDRVTRVPVLEAPDGIYELPAELDCRACHESGAVPVLGVSALQLSPERPPNARRLATCTATAGIATTTVSCAHRSSCGSRRVCLTPPVHMNGCWTRCCTSAAVFDRQGCPAKSI